MILLESSLEKAECLDFARQGKKEEWVGGGGLFGMLVK